jgi:hypothetical protein
VKERRWTLWVHDARGKLHRGVVSHGDDAPTEPPDAPAEFHIALLARPAAVRRAPSATAICVPRLSRTRAIIDSSADHANEREIVAGLKRGELPPAVHAQYLAGRIALSTGEIEARSVFSRGCVVDLEHLARVLVEQTRAEALAPFTAIIRRELRLPPGADALVALEARLAPPDPAERPPARAPGILRLRSLLSRLKAGALPQTDLETMIEDLRFLRLFEREESPLDRRALDRLLADVIGGVPPRKTKQAKRKPAPILRMRPRGDA